jgi:hypothetical protein
VHHCFSVSYLCFVLWFGVVLFRTMSAIKRTEEEVEGVREGVGERSRSPLEKRIVRVSLSRCDDIVRSRSGSVSSSTSEVSMRTVSSRSPSPGRLWRKRHGTDTEDEVPQIMEKEITAKRKRGRPPTTGQYVGLAAAKKEYDAAMERELELQAEEELAAEVQMRKKAQESFRRTPPARAPSVAASDLRADQLIKAVESAVDTINLIAQKSSKLKGQYVRDLKQAASSVLQCTKELQSRTESEEVARLQAELRSMRAEVEILKKQADSAPLTMSRDEIAFMINARFEGIQSRLLPEPRLRPPLAADKKRDSITSPPLGKNVTGPLEELVLAIPASATVPITVVPTSGQSQKKPTGRKKKSAAAREAEEARNSRPSPVTQRPATERPATEEWSSVVKRSGKSKKAQPAASAQAQKKNKTPKLRPPRTAAVVLAIQPGAEEKGVNFSNILSEAEKSIDLKALGIEGVKFRTAATGARILTVAGSNSAEKADTLATSLRLALGEAVKVSRPEKCVELRISGLDDAATKDRVAAVVAAEGACAPEAIKVGEITRIPGRQGTVWVKCPIAAGKNLTDGRRVLIGWSSVRVVLLEQRPLRCFRCLEVGHVGVKCTAGVDRSALCFCCGQAGHKAKDCAAKPHCPACAAEGRVATHRINSKDCPAGARKLGKKTRVQAVNASIPTSRAEETMETDQAK